MGPDFDNQSNSGLRQSNVRFPAFLQIGGVAFLKAQIFESHFTILVVPRLSMFHQRTRAWPPQIDCVTIIIDPVYP